MLLDLLSTYEDEEVVQVPAPLVLVDDGGGGAADPRRRSRILFRIIDELEVDLFGVADDDPEAAPAPRRRRRRFREIEEDGQTVREEIAVPGADHEEDELVWSLDGAARWALLLGAGAAVLAGPLVAAYAAGATLGGSLVVATARVRLGAFLKARAARRLPGPRELE